MREGTTVCGSNKGGLGAEDTLPNIAKHSYSEAHIVDADADICKVLTLGNLKLITL
jgi:hypothetical protein